MSQGYDGYEPLSVTAGSTSYFSEPEPELDPSLFEGTTLRAHVRTWILDTVLDFLDDHFTDAEHWARIWIAGSGVSW